MNKIIKHLNEILESDLSNRKLSIITDVDIATISRLRNGQRSLSRLQFGTVVKLYEAYRHI